MNMKRKPWMLAIIDVIVPLTVESALMKRHPV